MTSVEYRRWCEQGGVEFGPITAAYVADGWRGVVATTELQAGDVLLSVPERLLLNRRSAEADPDLGPLLKQPCAAGLSSHQVLAVHLLHEVSKARASTSTNTNKTTTSSSSHNPQAAASTAEGSSSSGPGSSGATNSSPSSSSTDGSRWAPYLRELPRTYTTFCCWGETEAMSLQAGHAVQAAQGAIEKADAEWRGAVPLMETLGLPRKLRSLPAWRWAASTLLSRTMYLPWDEAGALTPFGDLHNYQPPAPPCPPDIVAQPAAGAGAGEGQARDGTTMYNAGEAGSELGSAGQAKPDEGQGVCEGSQGAEAAPSEGRAKDDGVGTAGVGELQGTADNSSEGTGAVAQKGASSALGASQGGEALGSVEQAGPEAAAAQEGRGDEGEKWLSGDGLYHEPSRTYRLYARRRYKAGEQVLLCYGRHTNLQLLELYGFMLEDNPHEEAVLPLELLHAVCSTSGTSTGSTGVPTAGAAGAGRGPRKAGPGKGEPTATGPFVLPLAVGSTTDEVDWWAVLGVDEQAARQRKPRIPEGLLSQEQCFLHLDGRPSWGLLLALRTAAATPAERKSCSHLLAAGQRASVAGDVQVVRWLALACLTLLRALPTTAVEDEKELAGMVAAAADAGAGEEQQQQGGAKQPEEGSSSSNSKVSSSSSSTGPSCAELAVRWRLLYKRILQRGVREAMRCETALLAGGEAGPG